jgi:hypothetical protein
VILSDFTCPEHGTFERLVDVSAESVPCRECGADCPWTPAPIRCRVRIGEVERGGVDKPDSPMYLDTRELGEGMPYDEWKAKRDKVYEDRRHKESKAW